MVVGLSILYDLIVTYNMILDNRNCIIHDQPIVHIMHACYTLPFLVAGVHRDSCLPGLAGISFQGVVFQSPPLDTVPMAE